MEISVEDVSDLLAGYFAECAIHRRIGVALYEVYGTPRLKELLDQGYQLDPGTRFLLPGNVAVLPSALRNVEPA